MYQNPILNAPLGPDGLPVPVDPKKVQEFFEVRWPPPAAHAAAPAGQHSLSFVARCASVVVAASPAGLQRRVPRCGVCVLRERGVHVAGRLGILPACRTFTRTSSWNWRSTARWST